MLVLCWESGNIPQDWKDADIVTLHKNKGDRSDCNNYRGILLLSIPGKIIAKICLLPIQTLVESIYPEAQCSLGAQRSAIDTVFFVRQQQEQCRERYSVSLFIYLCIYYLFMAFYQPNQCI